MGEQGWLLWCRAWGWARGLLVGVAGRSCQVPAQTV